MKEISIDTSIYDLVESHPEIKELLISLGFDQLNNKAMFNTVARVMTLRKVARSHKVSLEEIEASLNTIGYTLKKEDL